MDHPAADRRARHEGAEVVKPMKPPNDLVLTYKGKSVVVLAEAEIVNNTLDAMTHTGMLIDSWMDAMKALGVLEDIEKT